MNDEDSSMVGIPPGIENGEYLVSVEQVLPGQSLDGTTVEASLRPVESARSPLTVLLSDDVLADPSEGVVHRVTVTDGSVVESSVDLDRTVNRGLDEVSDGTFTVPVRTVHGRRAALDGPRHLSLQKNHSVLALGEPGSGKTEFIKLLLPQIDAGPDEPVVVFDFKGEYREWARRHADVVRLSPRDATRHWNVFEEAETASDFEEIARLLFAEPVTEDRDPFFPRAARQVFEAVLKYLSRTFEANGSVPTNERLRRYFDATDQQEVFRDISGHDDLQGASVHIDPDAAGQAAGVYANLQLLVRNLLMDDFAREGTFSVREYMDDPDGRVLVLDYPIEQGRRVERVYQFFLNWAIKHALADADRNAYFVLDEFARVPYVENIEMLVATGRSRNTQAILGLQSVSQLEDTYGQATARNVMSGLTQEVFLRTGDPRSVEYVTDRLGGERHVTAGHMTTRRPEDDGVDSESVTEPVVGPAVQALDTGEGIVATDDGHAHVSLPMWDTLGDDTRRALRTRERRTARQPVGDAPVPDRQPSAQD